MKISRTFSEVAKLCVAMATAAFHLSSFWNSHNSATVYDNHLHCHPVTEPGAFRWRSSAGYLGVLLVAAVDLGDALLGALGGRGRGEGLLHPAGSLPQPTLDAKGFVQLVHLEAKRERERPPTLINMAPKGEEGAAQREALTFIRARRHAGEVQDAAELRLNFEQVCKVM